MAETKIQWCSTVLPDGNMHPGWTFNTHWGCTEAGPECDNCYARVFANRMGFDIWGKNNRRRFFKKDHFNKLLEYNLKAQKLNTRLKVFCNSMSDLFEPRADLEGVRKELFDTIGKTDWLNYLLLTKHPNRIKLPDGFDPKNVWWGTSVGVDKSRWRIPKIAAVPGQHHFLSIEPMLEPLPNIDLTGISWVVVGGESGFLKNVRPCKIEWIEGIVDQCKNAGVPVFVKQLGVLTAKHLKLVDSKGGNIDEWPEHLRIRQFPVVE